MPESLLQDYFDGVYAASADPWNFETASMKLPNTRIVSPHCLQLATSRR